MTDYQDDEPADTLFVDVAALLANGMPTAPEPVLLHRVDGHALFYAAKVNVIFGDPEAGKTWIGLAAAAEALDDGRRAAIIDLDHNGAQETIGRLLLLGTDQKALANPDRFRLAEPEDSQDLIKTVEALAAWRPAVVLIDSLGEILPMLGLSSNSPDDYTIGHRQVLSPMARAGAAVIAIDHLPKGDDERTHGQTGTLAKRRAINGASLRATVDEAFAPGRGGSTSLTIAKDRPGGLRAHCPSDGKTQPT
ncbi:MAG: AAA family ATPase, partial [Actinomycetes bacterium]